MFESIKLLQSKLRSAIKSRSKNVNLTIDEASMLLTEINAIIISKSESDKKIIDLLQNASEEKIEFESGSF